MSGTQIGSHRGGRVARLATMVLVVVGVGVPATAQWLQLPTAGIPRSTDGKPDLTAATPRTGDHHPNLTGLWTTAGLAGDIFDAVKAQPWLQPLIREREDNFGKDAPEYQCLPLGPGYFTNGGMRRILHTPDLIAILNADLTYRQIFTDGRALEDDPNRNWMGYSVGHWQGDTLVVESNGFNDRTWLNNGGLSHTEALRMTERYTRPDFGHLIVEVTFTDPQAYTTPLHLTVTMTYAADTELLEAVCENPQGQQHWVGKASDAQRTAVRVHAEVLSRYIGVYKGLWGRTPRTVAVTLRDGSLFVTLADRGAAEPMVPQSETLFIARGLGYQFLRDQDGRVTAVIEQHVSGAYTYRRQQ